MPAARVRTRMTLRNLPTSGVSSLVTTYKAQQMLPNLSSEKMEVADIEAVLWYHVNKAYSNFGVRNSETDSYEQIARE